MVTPTRIARGLGVLGVIGFMALATTSSIATSDLQDDPLAPGLPEAPAIAALEDPLPAPLPTPEPKLQDSPALPDAAPAPTEPEPLKELPPAPDEPSLKIGLPPSPSPAPSPAPAPALVDEPASNPLPPARDLAPASTVVDEPAARPRASSDDPDALARSFVERNRKEAEEQLKVLREESAQLKARLGRIEAGIRRWEALADALNRSEDKAAVRTPNEADPNARPRARGDIQYIVPGRSAPVIIQSQPVTRSDYVPAPLPR